MNSRRSLRGSERCQAAGLGRSHLSDSVLGNLELPWAGSGIYVAAVLEDELELGVKVKGIRGCRVSAR